MSSILILYIYAVNIFLIILSKKVITPSDIADGVYHTNEYRLLSAASKECGICETS
jgi:hypothetical protein